MLLNAIEAIPDIQTPWQALIYLVLLVAPLIVNSRTARHAKIAAEAVTENHGSSMKDSVNRIEAEMAELRSTVDGLARQFEGHIAATTPRRTHRAKYGAE